MLLTDERFLAAALESIDEAFGVYDKKDRLIAYNDRYARLRASIGGNVILGVAWDDLVTASLSAGTISEALGREAEWLEQRRRARGAYSIVRHLPDGTAFQVNERRMVNGGIAVVWTDVTRLLRDRSISCSPNASRESMPTGRRMEAVSYDPNQLMADARRWREFALSAGPDEREDYLRRAAECEALVGMSLETPPIAG
jgi:hypothetical protein